MTDQELRAKWDGGQPLTEEERVRALMLILGYSQEAAEDTVYASKEIIEGDDIATP